MFSINPKSIKYLETARGVAFTADLLEHGKKVGTIENAGQGGWTHADVPDYNTKERLDTIAKKEHGVNGTEWYLEALMDKAEGVLLEELK